MNVLDYGFTFTLTKGNYDFTFKTAFESSNDGFVCYDIDYDGNKILIGFLIRMQIPYIKKYIITIVCGIDLIIVDKLLKLFAFNSHLESYYYFFENEEVQVLLEQHGFTVEKITGENTTNRAKVVEYKFVPPKMTYRERYPANNESRPLRL